MTTRSLRAEILETLIDFGIITHTNPKIDEYIALIDKVHRVSIGGPAEAEVVPS